MKPLPPKNFCDPAQRESPSQARIAPQSYPFVHGRPGAGVRQASANPRSSWRLCRPVTDEACEVAMIIVCPACETRFLVDDAALGVGERRVRCANCGHLWLYSRVADEIAKLEAAGETGKQAPVAPAPAEPEVPPLRAEPATAVDPPKTGPAAVLPRPREAAALLAQNPQNMAAAALVVFAAIVLGAIAVFGAVAARDG